MSHAPAVQVRIEAGNLTGELETLHQALGEAIGADAALRAVLVLVDLYGGASLYVPKRDSVEREARNAAIREMYKHHGIRAIAQAFNLADNTVREIVFDRNGRAPQAELEF